MDFIEFSAKTVNDAITEACQKFVVTSDKLEYEVVEEGSSGFLGIGSKPAVIRAKVKSSIQDIARDFLKSVFEAMNLVVVIDINYDEVKSLRIEAAQKLKEYRPSSVGQASRISGVSPADISVLLIYLEKNK